MLTLLPFIAIGLAGGVLSGTFGVGGGIILVPLMTLLLKMPHHQAQGTSLGIIAFSIVSMLVYHKQGLVDLKVVGLIGIGFVIGGLLGSHIALAIPEHILRKCFAVFMIIVACRMLMMK
jgi:uncharacterized membrane protein YfcA